jgi:hypothetical protein
LANAGQATATKMSQIVGEMSHDQVTRFLSKEDYRSKQLWGLVKPLARKVESEEGCLIFDDTIQEKRWTGENDIICWHFDHSQNRNVKGINLFNALYYSQGVSLPVAFEIIKKTEVYFDEASGTLKRKSQITKNELLREILQVCINNQLKFRYILMDSWFCAKENFGFIMEKKKHFIGALKDNRLMALSLEDKREGRFVAISSLNLSDQQAVHGWLKGFDHEVLFARRIFTNKDGSHGMLNLVCSDLALSGEQITAIYQKRWKVEEFHTSLKSNASLAKSPTRCTRTQSNHVFMSIYTVFKLECLKIKYHLNHFALRSKLLIKSSRYAFNQLKNFSFA